MTTITRRIEFDAAHRVLGHEGKCRYLHGHRYRAEVTVDSPDLDPLGRVIDFSIVKELIGKWIDDHWDHNTILHPDDEIVNSHPKTIEASKHKAKRICGRDPYIMQRGNPTAENIAAELFEKASELFLEKEMDFLRVTNVRIYETPNCWADCAATPASAFATGREVLALLTNGDTTKSAKTLLPAPNIKELARRAKVTERGLCCVIDSAGQTGAKTIHKVSLVEVPETMVQKPVTD